MAIGTSDGEYYPSHLESVLASIESTGQNPIDAGRVIRNKAYEQFRDENDIPGAPPSDIRSKTKVAENTDIRTLFPHMPEEERKAWEQSPPRELQFEYKGKSNILDIPKTLDSKGHEDGVFVDQLHPDLLKLNQDEYDIRFVPNHEIFHIRKKTKPPLVGEADLPENARPTAAEFTPDSTWAAMVDSMTNPDSKVPSAERMVQGDNNYGKVVDWLTEHGKTPGQEAQNWSAKEKLGYMLSTAMGLVGPGQKGPPNLSSRANLLPVDMKLSGADLGISNVEPRSFNPANSNIPGLGKAHSAMTPLELMSDTEFMQQLEKSHPEINSPYERALANQKLGRKEPTGDSADEFIQSLRRGNKPNLTLVDKNPTQEPQAGYKPSQEQIDAQRNQQRGAKVNVGQGKGVLNDNLDLVGAMVAKGMKPSEIAKRFDVTPLAVRNWIKRKGGINNIDDILKQRYQDEDK